MLIFLYYMFVVSVNFASSHSVEKCDALATYHKLHESHKVYLNSLGYTDERYIPKRSCFLCSKPNCDFSDDIGCFNKTSETPFFPVYNDLLEFGLYFSLFPHRIEAQVNLTDVCNIRVRIGRTRVNREFNLWVTYLECDQTIDYPCVEIISQPIRNLHNETCVFFTLKFTRNETVYRAESKRCTLLSTNLLTTRTIMRSVNINLCTLNHTDYISSHRSVVYRVLHYQNTTVDGVPFILPCSPGGYAVDPLTGLFVTGNYCRTLFEGYPGGLHLVLKDWYDVNFYYHFPKYTEEELITRVPLYINPDGTAKSIELMKPERINCSFLLSRHGCISFLSPRTSEEMKLDNFCQDEYKKLKEDLENIRAMRAYDFHIESNGRSTLSGTEDNNLTHGHEDTEGGDEAEADTSWSLAMQLFTICALILL